MRARAVRWRGLWAGSWRSERGDYQFGRAEQIAVGMDGIPAGTEEGDMGGAELELGHRPVRRLDGDVAKFFEFRLKQLLFGGRRER